MQCSPTSLLLSLVFTSLLSTSLTSPAIDDRSEGLAGDRSSHSRKRLRFEYRINHGYRLRQGDLPSVVLLTGDKLRCTGTLLAPDKILTAGHCACGGATNFAFVNISESRMRTHYSVHGRPISHVAYPRGYGKACDLLIGSQEDGNAIENQGQLGGRHDIAIVTTTEPFHLVPGFIELSPLTDPYVLDYDDHLEISNIGMHGRETPFVSHQRIMRRRSPSEMRTALVVGFGRDPGLNITGEVKFGIINLEECPQFPTIDARGSMCTAKADNLQVPDVGDSGGPLFDENGHVMGVTSISGHGWVVFASVLENADFIREQLHMF